MLLKYWLPRNKKTQSPAPFLKKPLRDFQPKGLEMLSPNVLRRLQKWFVILQITVQTTPESVMARVLMLPHLWWSISVKTLLMTTKSAVFFENKLLENFRITETVQRERNGCLKNISCPPKMSIHLNIIQTGLTHTNQGNWKFLLSSLMVSIFT